jgi:hypothetical protein
VPVPPNVVWEESNQMAFSIGADGAPHTGSRFALVNWDDVPAFISAMTGYSELIPAGGVRRFLPEPFPLFPHLFARTCRFVRQTDEPNDLGNLQSLTYPQVELEVGFNSLEYAVQTDEARPVPEAGTVATELYRYIIRHKSLSVHAVPLPRNLLEYTPAGGGAGAGEPMLEPGSSFVASGTIKLQMLEVPCELINGSPELPRGMRAAIDTQIGSVNTRTLDGRWARGTALMLAPTETFYKMSNGEWAATIDFMFELRGVFASDYDAVTSPFPDWGKVIRPDGLYHSVRQRSDHTKRIYPEFNADELFWPF